MHARALDPRISLGSTAQHNPLASREEDSSSDDESGRGKNVRRYVSSATLSDDAKLFGGFVQPTLSTQQRQPQQ